MQLADFANLTQPWAIDHTLVPRGPEYEPFSLLRAFKNAPQPPAIPLAELEREYTRLLGLPNPIEELPFVASWMLFRVSVVLFFSCSLCLVLSCCRYSSTLIYSSPILFLVFHHNNNFDTDIPYPAGHHLPRHRRPLRPQTGQLREGVRLPEGLPAVRDPRKTGPGGCGVPD
jgi:hypothetical protein